MKTIRRLGKSKFSIEIPFEENNEKCLVTVEGTNLELIKYLHTMIYSVLRSYEQNGIPKEFKEVEKMSCGDIHYSFKNKKTF